MKSSTNRYYCKLPPSALLWQIPKGFGALLPTVKRPSCGYRQTFAILRAIDSSFVKLAGFNPFLVHNRPFLVNNCFLYFKIWYGCFIWSLCVALSVLFEWSCGNVDFLIRKRFKSLICQTVLVYAIRLQINICLGSWFETYEV